MAIFIRLRPGEKIGTLISRFIRATKNEPAEFRARQYFISKTEERQLALKKKLAKIKKLKDLTDKGIL